MPRKSFVLLMFLMLAGLWTPPQGTKAQMGCSGGVCKVFLPVVLKNSVAVGAVEDIRTGEDCSDLSAIVAITNVTTDPLSNLQVEGVAISPDVDTVYPFAGMTDGVLFPGETNRYRFRVTEGFDECGFGWTTSVVHILNSSRVPQARSIEVGSTELILLTACARGETYKISGTIRNSSLMPMQNVRAILYFYFFTYHTDTLSIDTVPLDLAPGETVQFSQQFSLGYVYPDCDALNSPYPQYTFAVRAWGEFVP